MTDAGPEGIDVGLEALRLYTLKEVGDLCGCSAKTIERLTADWDENPGTGLESIKMGKLRRVTAEAITVFKKRLVADERHRAEARTGAALWGSSHFAASSRPGVSRSSTMRTVTLYPATTGTHGSAGTLTAASRVRMQRRTSASAAAGVRAFSCTSSLPACPRPITATVTA